MARTLASAAALIGLLAMAPAAVAQTTGPVSDVTLTLPQMRIAAARAIALGQYPLAVSMAQAMLSVAPDDSYSHFIIAQAFLRDGQPQEARPAARLSYRLAETPTQKHEAARIAALTAAAQERYFPAQIWMRRALQSAPNEQMKARAVAEFRAVRREARLNLNFALSVAPSSNINGGSSEELNTIDGVPLVGILSPDARALSGTVAQGDARARYRLQRSARSQTDLHATTQIRRIELSREARDKAPNARSKTYNSTLVEFGLSHARKLGDSGPIVRGGVFAGQVWFGGDHAYDYGRGELALVQRIAPRTALTLGAVYQEQWNDTGPYSDIETTGWNGGISHLLANQDRLSLSIATSSSDSVNSQQTGDTRSLQLGYDRAEPLGPVKLSADLLRVARTYPDYRVIFPVPGGREDISLSANLDLTFHTLDYAGFVPTLRLSAEQSDSNVSRFDTEEFSVSVGFASAF